MMLKGTILASCSTKLVAGMGANSWGTYPPEVAMRATQRDPGGLEMANKSANSSNCAFAASRGVFWGVRLG